MTRTCQLLRLTPLDDDTSRALVADVLQHVSDRPDSLVELITRRAEGNPFFVEELIKMLIDDGVIIPGADPSWRGESTSTSSRRRRCLRR